MSVSYICTVLKIRGILDPVPIEESDVEAARSQLERILGSAGFSRNERLGRFLGFVVQQHLEGKASEIKESVIAIEVFGRRPDHDPKHDSIVRTEAARLRARLAEYYLGEGKNDSFIIELPKGGYAPVFRQAASESRLTALGSVGTPRRPTTTVRLLMVLAGVLAAAGVWSYQHQKAPIRIAVLPLTNLSQDPAHNYFADGLTDEIIRNLSIIEGLEVRSRTSSFAFKGKPLDVREVGTQLAADYILDGSVLRAGQHLRVNVQLIRVRDDFPLWSTRLDEELTDIFVIQDKIALGIVNSLRLKLGRGRRRYETSPEAYDLYLRARAATDIHSVNLFEQAIAKDPSFAPAYAGLAALHAFRSGLFRLDPAGEVPNMRAAAEKAIQLDPLLAEAHDALGMAYARDAQWAQSEKSFRRGIELDHNRSETYHHFATFLLWPLDRTNEALQALRLAEKADPLSVSVHLGLCYVLPSAGRYDEAAIHGEKMPADSHSGHAYLGRARFLQGRTTEAIQILETAFRRGVTSGSEVRAFLGYAYARTGRRDDAEKMAIGTNPFNQAVIFAGLGDKDRAMEAMEGSYAAGPFRIGRQLTWPELALIRGEPRMKALRKEVGLP
jgi:TolB-like protein/tetratricopeptide (TPR) repeat protein